MTGARLEIWPSGSPQGEFAVGWVTPDSSRLHVIAYRRTKKLAETERKRLMNLLSVKDVIGKPVPPNDEEAVNTLARQSL